jgi:hypothetical protein
MTYSPDPLRHTELADSAALWCSVDGVYCTADGPCLCDAESGEKEAPVIEDPDDDGALEDELPAPVKVSKATGDMAPPPAKDQSPRPAAVQMIVDGDAGTAGETHG